MNVLDFDILEFNNFIKRTIIEEIIPFKKILVLGIAEGGIPIADIVFESLKNNELIVSRSFIKVQRPSTIKKKKSKFTRKLLKSIFLVSPKFVLNYLRIREHKILSKRLENDLVREIKLNSNIDFSLFDFVLIVDDAVDTGTSMKKTVDFVKEKAPKTTIVKTLSVVVTQNNPVYLPDYFWIRDVLIRFPWSLDGRK